MVYWRLGIWPYFCGEMEELSLMVEGMSYF